MKAGVRLHAIHRKNAIGACRVCVEIQRHAIVGARDLDGFHRGANLGAHRLLGHAQHLEHCSLPVGGGAAVAAHCRNHKRFGSKIA